MKNESTDDPEFAWYEEELNALRLTVNYAAELCHHGYLDRGHLQRDGRDRRGTRRRVPR